MNDPAAGTSADEIDDFRTPLDSESQPLFEAAFREHHSLLIQYLRRRVGNDHDARDIAQEAYLRVMRYREHQDVASLKALLYRIATNLVVMRARTAQARHLAEHRPLDHEFAVAANDPSHEQRLGSEQQLDLLMQAIKRLPTKCQQVFVLSRFHGMSYPEIAARCGVSVKTVEKHITKALALCRAEVGDDLP